MMEKLLQNPMVFKLALLTTGCIAVLLLAILAIRRIRKSLQAEADSMRTAQGNAGFALAAYEGLGRQLREQEKELQKLREQRQEETVVNGNITDAVLANLSCGVLFFDRIGTVRQANRAGKALLGYASPFSFHVRDLFRSVSRIKWPETGEEAPASAPLIHAIQESLRTGAPFHRAIVDYRTPGGQKRVLALMASAVRGKGGEVLGLSCVLDDLTEITELSQQVHRDENFASLGEISAGLANDFKKSLAMVRGHAQALLTEDSDAATRFHAEKVVAELDSLARLVDEFLEFAGSIKPHRLT
ncbi:MAG TPA: PAS domain-containing protein [Candidatus Angelobacter sp.]